jgi:hypothetical protein
MERAGIEALRGLEIVRRCVVIFIERVLRNFACELGSILHLATEVHSLQQDTKICRELLLAPPNLVP